MPDLPSDFFQKHTSINHPCECWEWNGKRAQNGYGLLYVRNGNRVAHREAYRFFKGEIFGGRKVCHACDNPPCCNPSHLVLGTDSDNKNDFFNKKRLGIFPAYQFGVVNFLKYPHCAGQYLPKL